MTAVILGLKPEECDTIYPRTRDGRCQGCGTVGLHPNQLVMMDDGSFVCWLCKKDTDEVLCDASKTGQHCERCGWRDERQTSVEVGPKHPLWISFDDDDWNGATCSQWLRSIKGSTVVLHPPSDINPELFARIHAAIQEAGAESVVVK